MARRNNTHPSEYVAILDKPNKGWAIYDPDYDIDVIPTRRFATEKEAYAEIERMIDDWEPKELGDAWDGGFADNH